MTDNGLSMNFYAANDTSRGLDDYGFSVAGDWGTIGFQGSDSGDAFGTATDVTPDEGQTISTAIATTLYVMPADAHVADSSISYKSPDISGFRLAFGSATNGASDVSSMGARYSMTSGDATITVKYAASDRDIKDTSFTNENGSRMAVALG